jgi:hypothetical protein
MIRQFSQAIVSIEPESIQVLMLLGHSGQANVIEFAYANRF